MKWMCQKCHLKEIQQEWPTPLDQDLISICSKVCPWKQLLISKMGHFPIVHFTVVCLVAKPLNRSEAKGDLVMIQTLLLLKCKLSCYHAN